MLLDCESQPCSLLIDSTAKDDCAPRPWHRGARRRKPYRDRRVRVKHWRKLSRTQRLRRQDDLPYRRGTDAFTQRGFACVNKRVRNNLPYRFGFRLIDERAVSARDNKVDLGLAEIA